MSNGKLHAVFAPSAAKRWMTCVGSVALTKDLPEESSEYADEGTAAHTLASMCLTDQKDARAYLGRRIAVGLRTFEVDEEMADAVQTYVNVVRGLAVNGELHVEQAVPIGHITGEEGAEGTADAVVLAFNDGELIVVDLKYGKGVYVSVERNEQTMLYALGALKKFELLGDWKRVRLFISQPRISEIPSEWDCSVEDLLAFSAEATEKAKLGTLALEHRANWIGKDTSYLTPGDHCKNTFCKARATCPALAAFVVDNVGADFDEIIQANDEIKELVPSHAVVLGMKMKSVDIIEDWCRAVRARSEAVLFEENNTPEVIEALGFKLVQGKRGNRQWESEEAAEKEMKAMRLKQEQMYSFKLITPTAAEKLLKSAPKRWKRIAPLITQSDGKPSVAPASDPRPALVLQPVADDFEMVGDLPLPPPICMPVDAAAGLV